MSLIHYLFLGHFEHNGEMVRFSKSPSDAVYRPAIRKPVDTEAINTILKEVKGSDVDNLSVPEEWRIWLKDGYLVCEKYTRNQEAIKFVSRLVERTCCDIYDVGAHCEVSLNDWLAMIHGYAQP
jgi:hypothetical protein